MEPLNHPIEGDTRTKLIINYLPQSMTEYELNEMFVSIGTVTNTKIMKDMKTGYSYGFGFVEYERPEDAATAIKGLNGLEIMDKKIKVSYSRNPGDDIKDTNLYITNVPRNASLENVEEWFGKYGRIVQSNLLKDKVTGMSRGVAFIRYDKKGEANAAMQGLNGTTPPGGSEPITVRLAQEFGKKRGAAMFQNWQNMQEQAGPEMGIWRRGFGPRYRGGGFRGGYMGRGRGNGEDVGAMRFSRGRGSRYNPMSSDYYGMDSW